MRDLLKRLERAEAAANSAPGLRITEEHAARIMRDFEISERMDAGEDYSGIVADIDQRNSGLTLTEILGIGAYPCAN